MGGIYIGIYAMLMSCKNVLTRSRALGFDTHVLRLNRNMFEIIVERHRLSPFMAARCIRMVVSGIRAAGEAIGRYVGSRPRRGEEEGQREPKSARDEALGEYRKILESTFNDKECIDVILFRISIWTDGV